MDLRIFFLEILDEITKKITLITHRPDGKIARCLA